MEEASFPKEVIRFCPQGRGEIPLSRLREREG
jgi:hypothetical protein